MIYAIPNDGERVANHFVKAPYIAIYSDTEGLLKNLANIASMPQAGCKAKSQLIQSLQEYQVDAVLVRNIGERALGKLLSSGKQVFKLSTRSSLDDVMGVPRSPLTVATQGRPSTKHVKKGGCGSKKALSLLINPQSQSKNTLMTLRPTKLKALVSSYVKEVK
ncbi:dinitrogenase iron-molybdenum cofactor [Vibrio campbellii]|uniref:NifB/NifX family molybdenum-iron cluster-binding protein n=1 Tax=Vibrio sp. LB10LO1 TaxID=2711207 RepID=UPI00138A3AA2|nr:NifB/NifX family molybdenum-iron cluster-binding protein [Vibrio sp. LB10LO1]NDJ80896.1 dinitrogenase iron-molybdenum cofactor [Vibrio sp. LB10LO1]